MTDKNPLLSDFLEVFKGTFDQFLDMLDDEY